MQQPDSRVIDISELSEAVEVISQAFVNDPLCAFMLPTQRTRLKTVRKFFTAYATIYIRNGKGYGVSEPLKGVAFWLEPAAKDISVSIKSLGLFLPLLVTHYPIGYLRAHSIIRETELMHQKYASERHYYLDNLAVLPSEQGKGYASHLLRPILYKADAQGSLAYTDTVTRANVPLYEHFGFQVMETRTIEKAGITVWALRRSSNK